jgi:hypothetical protein
MTLLVASTVAPYKFQAPIEETEAWLTHAEAWSERGHQFFLAIETNLGRELEEGNLAVPIMKRLADVGGNMWTFSIETGDLMLTGGGRLIRICTGRNLAHEVFNRNPGRWEGILFLDTDVEPPEDAPERLLEVDHELVGFNVPTYCMDGPPILQAHDDMNNVWRAVVDGGRSIRGMGPVSWSQPDPFFPLDADVRVHWNTAGALLVRDHAVRHLRWRYDLSRGQTDDPCFQEDAIQRGYGQTWVRHDMVGKHHPETIAPLEKRGLDLRL